MSQYTDHLEALIAEHEVTIVGYEQRKIEASDEITKLNGTKEEYQRYIGEEQNIINALKEMLPLGENYLA